MKGGKKMEEETKKTKKFNKKYLVFGILGVFALVLVSALTYYAFFSVTLSINQPINVDGDLTQPVVCNAGETCRLDGITVTNDGTNSREIVITDNSEIYSEAIDEMRYIGLLELSQKNTGTWVEDGEKVSVEYVAVGDSFSVKVVGEDIEGYELVYYADDKNSQTVAEREANPQPVIRLNEIVGNLPYLIDGNWQEDTDYSGEPDFYNQWKGAKLWYIPTTAINESDNTLDWSQWDGFYYETDLIQFNSDGEIVLFSGASLTIYPEVEINKWATEGNRTLEIEIA